jgi:hypothetical protein
MGATAIATVISMPHAPLGRSDVTRRWGLTGPDGESYFCGVTRPEGVILAERLIGVDVRHWNDGLVEVRLPAVLTGGAGPHLLAADGSLVIVLGPHAPVSGTSVAMSEPMPLHWVGLVEPVGPTGWTWRTCAAVSQDDRVEALDQLSVSGPGALPGWSAKWGGPQ